MLGIVGGTGLYELDGLKHVETVMVDTPFGQPSADIVVGELSDNGNTKKGGIFAPAWKDPQPVTRGNQFQGQYLGIKIYWGQAPGFGIHRGQPGEKVRPGDLAIPSQYTDFTKGQRENTFFGNGLVAHISTANPSCPELTRTIKTIAEDANINVHTAQTYACVEGPRLGTRSESFFLKNSGSHIVGMTNVPEVFLAREAQICYATIAVVTDYDCWLEDPEEHATVDKVMSLYRENITKVKQILAELILSDTSSQACDCRNALDGAVMTPENCIPSEGKALLGMLRL